MKVLVLYTAHTLGHKQIAENVAWHLREASHEVVLEEVLKSANSAAVNKFLKVHIFVNRYLPFIWWFLYRYGFWFTMPFRLLVACRFAPILQRIINSHSPDLVVTTQTSPSAVMSVIKKTAPDLLWLTAFSDFHFHRYWVYPRCDGFLVNIREQAEKLVKLGIPKHQIFRIGMGLFPSPSLKSVDKTREELGVGQDEKVVLVTVGGGTLGQGIEDADWRALQQLSNLCRSSNLKVKILIACGKDQVLFQKVETMSKQDHTFRAVRFYTPFIELVRCADLALGKLGGMTTAECLYEGVRVFSTRVLPGQEEMNLDYLVSRNLVVDLSRSNPEQRARILFEALQQQKPSDQQLSAQKGLVSPDSEPAFSAFIKSFSR